MDNDEIKYFESNKIGKGLPYAVTSFENLSESDDIFVPSLRDFHVVFFIKKGTGTYFVDFKEYTFQANTLILLSKDQLHHFSYFTDEVDLASVTFKPEFIYRNETDLQHLFQFISSLHEPGQQVLNIPEFAQKQIEDIFHEMQKVYSNWSSTYQAKAFYHWLCLLLIQIEMMQEGQSGQIPVIDDNQKNAISFKQLIEKHYKTEFKVEFYAEQLNIPLKTLSKASHTLYKMAPKALINERRLLEIKRQLRGTGKSAKAIAYELNFDEPTNLFKFFRKHVGQSPNEFRDLVK